MNHTYGENSHIVRDDIFIKCMTYILLTHIYQYTVRKFIAYPFVPNAEQIH